MDFVVNCKQFPDVGQTVFGYDFFANPGGKGANQAVAIARLGGNVKFIGCVGDDAIGCQLIQNMQRYNIDTTHIKTCTNISSGVAQISVDSEANNKIIVIPGANNLVDKQCIDNARGVIKNASIVVCQHEIPSATVEYVSDMAARFGVPMILNPAPAYGLSEQLINGADFLIPNESEASLLTGIEVVDLHSGYEACKWFHAKGAKNVIITLGSEGCLIYNESRKEHVPSVKVHAIDTTAAGDTFIGAFAWYVVNRKYDIRQAVEFSVKAAAISVTRKGAQVSMPILEEVEHSG
jgi:ribokinase